MKNNNSVSLFLLLFISVAVFFACKQTPTSIYTQTVKQELAKGERLDSLFLGFKMGMRADSFFSSCRKMNQEQIIREGIDDNAMVIHYDMQTEFKSPAAMNFFPKFKDTTMLEMGISFTYDGWAPWNEEMKASKLLPEVKTLLEKWYGVGFFSIGKKQGEKVWVKIDGNRRILLFVADDHRVRTLIADLTRLDDPTRPLEPADLK